MADDFEVHGLVFHSPTLMGMSRTPIQPSVVASALANNLVLFASAVVLKLCVAYVSIQHFERDPKSYQIVQLTPIHSLDFHPTAFPSQLLRVLR